MISTFTPGVTERQKQTCVYLSNQDTYDYKRNLCIRFFHFQYWLSDAVEATTGAGQRQWRDSKR